MAGRLFGTYGVLATAAIAGTNDVHAATLAASTLAMAGSIGPKDALLAMLVAFLVNMAVKLTITGVAGSRHLLATVAPPLVAMTAAAIAAFVLI